MSATDWGVCPNCLRRHKEKIAKKRAELEGAYGVLPLVRFDELRTLVQAMEYERDHWDDDTHRTLREDYNGVGVDEDGEFSIVYIASCQACPFDYRYEFREQALTEDLITKFRRTETEDEIS